MALPVPEEGGRASGNGVEVRRALHALPPSNTRCVVHWTDEASRFFPRANGRSWITRGPCGGRNAVCVAATGLPGSRHGDRNAATTTTHCGGVGVSGHPGPTRLVAAAGSPLLGVIDPLASHAGSASIASLGGMASWTQPPEDGRTDGLVTRALRALFRL